MHARVCDGACSGGGGGVRGLDREGGSIRPVRHLSCLQTQGDGRERESHMFSLPLCCGGLTHALACVQLQLVLYCRVLLYPGAAGMCESHEICCSHTKIKDIELQF